MLLRGSLHDLANGGYDFGYGDGRGHYGDDGGYGRGYGDGFGCGDGYGHYANIEDHKDTEYVIKG